MISLSEYTSHDGLGLADLVARKQVKPEELVTAALQAVEKVNPKINAVLQTLPTQSAESVRVGLPQGPFTGVPFLIKERISSLVIASAISSSLSGSNLTLFEPTPKTLAINSLFLLKLTTIMF